ncbi:MAG: hypothetical protein L0H96_20335 [Humibacillus sp.]|nr:hypothetical protein [Humibacillus sp.]MDN5779245.1 hypothetical protein [Humibacillus sp.]
MSSRSASADAFSDRMTREREEAEEREAARRRPVTAEAAAALTAADWDDMSGEYRNRLYRDQPEHYVRLRDRTAPPAVEEADHVDRG